MIGHFNFVPIVRKFSLSFAEVAAIDIS